MRRGLAAIGRWAWLGLGVVALGLAIAGAVLPLLPTTPFLLLAAFAFARSSPRLEAWLLDHAHFGPVIADWRRGGAVSRRVKATASLVMAATLLGGWLVGLSSVILGVQALVFVGVAGFLWSRPEPSATGEERRRA